VVDEGIPAELREFIANCIDTVGQLEALLLLRSNPQQGWTAQPLGARLYVSEIEATDILAHLVIQGFVTEQDASYYYDREGPQVAVIDRLAEAYARQLIPITKLIHAKPRPVRAFADAFKIKRDK
jgi:hypothetical protein